jgi:hypothetical protein
MSAAQLILDVDPDTRPGLCHLTPYDPRTMDAPCGVTIRHMQRGRTWDSMSRSLEYITCPICRELWTEQVSCEVGEWPKKKRRRAEART